MKGTLIKAKNAISVGLIFKIVYLLLGFLSFNSLLANSSILTLISYGVTAFGGVYFLYRLFHFGTYKRTKGIIILCLFLVSYVVSSLFAAKYGIVSNIKAAIWMSMQFFLLYAYDSSMSTEKIKKECTILGWVVVVYTFAFSALGLVCWVFNYYKYEVVEGVATITGFIWNRLWGLYSDPNYGAVFGIVSTLISVMFFLCAKKVIIKIFLALNVVIQFFYIAFSDSRTAQIALVVTAFWSVAIMADKAKWLAKLRPLYKRGIAVVLAAFTAVLSLVAVSGAVRLGNAYLSAVKNPESPLFYWMDEEKREDYFEDNQITEDEEIKNSTVGRPIEDLGSEGGDISNRRFAIWKSGLEIFSTSPIIGVSFRNMVPYALENLPETYIVNNNQCDFGSMHNMFVDVLVSQGAVGILLLAAFMLIVLITAFTKLFKLKGERYLFCMSLLCVIVPVFVSCFFYSEIFFINTAGSVIFWMALGYLMNMLSKPKEEVQNA